MHAGHDATVIEVFMYVHFLLLLSFDHPNTINLYVHDPQLFFIFFIYSFIY